MRPHRRQAGAIVALAFALLPTAPATAGQREALKHRVRAYSAAYLGGEADVAWSYLSRRCQLKVGRDTFGEVVRAAHERYGSARLRGRVRISSMHRPRARVTYRFTVPALDQVREPWVLQRRAWRVNDC